MAKDPNFPVRLYVDLTEVQVQRITVMREKHGVASDSETIRHLLTVLFDILDKDPLKDE